VKKLSLLLPYKRISQLWQRVSTPASTVKNADERIRSGFLAQLFLLISLTITTILTLRFLLYPDVPNIDLRLGTTWIAGLLLLASYWAVRQGYAIVAGVIQVIQATFLVVAFASLSVTLSAYQSTLTFLVAVILFTSQFYPIRFTLIVATFHLLILLLLPLMIPFLTITQMIKGPISFYVLMISLVLIFAYYRSRIEQARRSQLAESEARFKMVSDLVPNYAFSVRVDNDGTLRQEWVTDEFSHITGYPAEELDNNLTARLFHPDDLTRYTDGLKQAHEGKSTADEYRIITQNGEIRWLRINRHVVWDERQQRMVRFYGVAQDITAQRQAEKENFDLVVQGERSKLVRDFVTALSHDFRTSLATIETSRYLAERLMQQTQYEKSIAKLGSIRRAVNHMSAQIENLNAITTLNHLQRSYCDLNELILDVVDELLEKARQNNQMIMFQPNGYIPQVKVDSEELQRAVRELLRNALSFMPAGGVVTIKTSMSGAHIDVSIHDTGIGIAPEHLEHIFDLFYRVDVARGVDTGGVGLGLSVAKMIVAAHAGTIEVESIVDKGSTFTIHLPTDSVI
jgi:PAS domain S-box-containing protein